MPIVEKVAVVGFFKTVGEKEYYTTISIEEAANDQYKVRMQTCLASIIKDGQKILLPPQECTEMKPLICATKADAESEVARLYSNNLADGWKLDTDSTYGLSRGVGSPNPSI